MYDIVSCNTKKLENTKDTDFHRAFDNKLRTLVAIFSSHRLIAPVTVSVSPSRPCPLF